MQFKHFFVLALATLSLVSGCAGSVQNVSKPVAVPATSMDADLLLPACDTMRADDLRHPSKDGPLLGAVSGSDIRKHQGFQRLGLKEAEAELFVWARTTRGNYFCTINDQCVNAGGKREDCAMTSQCYSVCAG